MKITELPLSEQMKQTLTTIGFTEATPIQEKAIPIALSGQDVIGQAQTGTGKTAGFSVPIIEQMEANKTLQTLILVPTRELALQVSDSFKQMSTHTKVRVATVFGGTSIEKQIRELKSGFECVVATPGRCIDLMKRRVLKTDAIRFLVLDEVDEMLSMGFIDDIETISEKITGQHQTLFFSATMNKKIEAIANKFLTNPAHIKIAPSDKNLKQINQSYLVMRDVQKADILSDLLHVQKPERAIIFARTKRRVDDLSERLTAQGFLVDRIHGDLSQEQRTFTFKKFRAGQTKILIATDVAARGLDIKELSHVYNFDLPQELEYYVHRIGRTGRADAFGEAISFFTPGEVNKLLPQIERKTKSKLTKMPHPTIDDVVASIEQQGMTKLVENIPNVTSKEHFAAAKQLLQEVSATELVASALMLLTPEFDKEAFVRRHSRDARANERRQYDRRDGGGYRGGDRNRGGGDRRRSRSGNGDSRDRNRGDRDRRNDRDGSRRNDRDGGGNPRRGEGGAKKSFNRDSRDNRGNRSRRRND